MINLIVYEPTERFLNFLNTHNYSYEYEPDANIIDVDNYQHGSFKGVIGCNAKAFIDGKWVSI
ncbi:MAG: hypothetical protein AB1349_13865 [Elusimicrobiota bacterium]